jgi:hypothetical protein
MFPAWFFWKLHVAVTRATVFLRLRGRPKFNVPSIFEGGHILTKFRVNCRRMCATFTTKFDLYQISEIRHRVILAWKSRWINWFFCYCRPNDAANPVLRMCKASTLIGTREVIDAFYRAIVTWIIISAHRVFRSTEKHDVRCFPIRQ